MPAVPMSRRCSRRRSTGRSPTWSRSCGALRRAARFTEGVEAQSEIARRLLEDPSSAGRRLVWSYNSAGAITKTFLEIRPDLPLVVFLKASNRLVNYAAERQDNSVTAVDLLTAQSTVEHALGQRVDATTYLTLEVPDLPLDSTRQHDVHVCFDSYVELAFAAAEWLMKEHGGPSLDDAPRAARRAVVLAPDPLEEAVSQLRGRRVQQLERHRAGAPGPELLVAVLKHQFAFVGHVVEAALVEEPPRLSLVLVGCAQLRSRPHDHQLQVHQIDQPGGRSPGPSRHARTP